MESVARKQYLRISPRKLRPLVDLARGKPVGRALDDLRFAKHKMAVEVVQLIKSAINNASQAHRALNPDDLFVKRIFVDQGPILKRIMTRARGSAARILKRMAHLTVIVDTRDVGAEAPKQNNAKKIRQPAGEKKPAKTAKKKD